MNTPFNLDNVDEFVNMCGSGNICLQKPIEIRNISGNQILQRSLMIDLFLTEKN